MTNIYKEELNMSKEGLNMSKEGLNMSKEELEVFFNKYSILELESFNGIFEYVHDYDLTEVLEVIKKVYKEKYDICFEEYELPARHYNYSLMDIARKNELLSDKELEFLNTLVENAVMFLDVVQSNAEVYKQIIEDFSCGEYKINEMFTLEEALGKEILIRKNHSKQKVIKKVATNKESI